MKASQSLSLLLVIFLSVPTVFAKGVQDVNVVNTPIPVQSVVRRVPVSCVVPSFNESGNHDARCIGPDGLVTPVPSGFFLAITDVIATSQAIAGSAAQAIVRVSSKNQSGIQFGAGVPMLLKPGETQSLHYQSPNQVLPAGRTPTASVAVNFGSVFPVEVYFTGYLVAEDDLGR